MATWLLPAGDALAFHQIELRNLASDALRSLPNLLRAHADHPQCRDRSHCSSSSCRSVVSSTCVISLSSLSARNNGFFLNRATSFRIARQNPRLRTP